MQVSAEFLAEVSYRTLFTNLSAIGVCSPMTHDFSLLSCMMPDAGCSRISMVGIDLASFLILVQDLELEDAYGG